MAEYPEILQLSRQMNSCVAGKSFKNIHVVQRKCLNMDIQPFLRSAYRQQCYRGMQQRQMDSFNFRSGLSFANQPRNGRRCTVF